MKITIPFNKPTIIGNEAGNMLEAINSGRLSGNGPFTKRCQSYFELKYGLGKCLLTSSGTDALEMAAILAEIEPGDEVILPTYTFVSTANAFVLRGAKLIFVDSQPDHPGMDEKEIGGLITSRTKVIVVVHYAGVACDMEPIMKLATMHRILVVEDAAHSIDSFYTFSDGKQVALGSIGDLAAFSFHETKNITCGEGGMLVVNNRNLFKRSEVIWEKGTDRMAFYRGEVDKYGWVDIGSSFLPSEITAGFLFAQIEKIATIQERRKNIWRRYSDELDQVAIRNGIRLPHIPKFATNNAHMFYLICADQLQRDEIILGLKRIGVLSVFHYQSLHSSKYYVDRHDGRSLPNADMFTRCLLRLPIYYNLSERELDYVISSLKSILA